MLLLKVFAMLVCTRLTVRGIKINSRWRQNVYTLNRNTISSALFSTESNAAKGQVSSGDLLVSALNDAQDISVKVVSCREIVQEAMLKNDLSTQAGHALAEVMVCSLMMGAGLKGEETLQINLVGDKGVRNVMAITDGSLKVRGMVGNGRFDAGPDDSAKTRDLFGDGQIQVVRNHPSWKQPMNGIVLLRDTSIALNLAMYMTESEQRSAFLLTDVKVTGNLCRYALGIMVERLPGATEENIERSVKNLEEVEKKGLRSYLSRTEEERKKDENEFRDFDGPLNRIIDDCLAGMNEGSIRWDRVPEFRCSCSMEKVWRTLGLLPKDEIRSIVTTQDKVEVGLKTSLLFLLCSYQSFFCVSI